jgi:putative Mg2+ transporter-C (MgtC) family protein
VGVLAGIGAWPFAMVLTGLVVFINLGLRPLVKWLKRNTKAGVPVMRFHRVVLICAPDQETAMRGLLLRGLAGLRLQEVTAHTADGALHLSATLASDDLGEGVEQAVQRLAAEPGIQSLRWMPADEI